MKQILKILLIVIILGAAGFIGLRFYQTNSKESGILQATLTPKTAIVTINGRVYKTVNGILNIKLAPQEYSISFSYPGYSIVNKVIELRPQQNLDLGPIYLFPVSWPQEQLVANDNIEKFYTNTNKTLIVYLVKTAKAYDWYLYNRNTKDSQKFYQTNSLPQEIMFTPDVKKLIINLKENDWRVVFLPKSLIETDIDLDNRFITALKKSNWEIKPTPQIQQILALANNSNDEIIVRTLKGVYRFNYLEQSVNQIIDSPVSPLIVENNELYFIKNNGILSSFDLNTFEEKQLSFFVFKEADEELNKIIIKKIPQKDIFIAIKENGKTYLLNSPTEPPNILSENIQDISISKSTDKILLYQLNKGLSVYDLSRNITTPLDILSTSLPQWFLDDNCLLLSNDSNLRIYNFVTQETWSITNSLKNSDFIYDNALNYIFYLSSQGIIKTGL